MPIPGERAHTPARSSRSDVGPILVATFTRPRPARWGHTWLRGIGVHSSALCSAEREASEKELSFEQRKARRQEASREILDAFSWLEELGPQVLPRARWPRRSATPAGVGGPSNRYLGDSRRSYPTIPRRSGHSSRRCSRPQELALRRERRRRSEPASSTTSSPAPNATRSGLRLPARTLRAAPEPPSRPTPNSRASGAWAINSRPR